MYYLWLNKLKVDIGFKQEMPINKKRNFSNFEIFREDHANIVKRV